MSSPDLKDTIARYLRDVAANPRTRKLTERQAMNLGEQAQENVRWGIATIADLEKQPAISSADVQPVKRDDLRPGDRGDDVARIQSQLSRHGFEMVADGVFGPRTAAAVREFQRRHSLEQDGIVGPRTEQALLARSDSPLPKKRASGPVLRR